MKNSGHDDYGCVTVLGGAGFIGSHLVDQLVNRGEKVIVVDDFSSGTPKNLERAMVTGNLMIVEHDVRETIPICASVKQVFNLASPASPVDYLREPVKTLEVGSLGTSNAIQFALDREARLIHASTSEIYGDPQEHPQREAYWGNVNPVGARSCYDESKRYAEALIAANIKSSGLNAGIARIFNTYGPRLRFDDGRVISNFIYQALNNRALSIYGQGNQTRSCCYVSDTVEGLLALSRSSYCGPVNIGNPYETTVLTLARTVGQLVGGKTGFQFLPLPEDDPKQRCPDIGRAVSLLAWKPKVNLHDGLEETIRWCRNNYPLGFTQD